MIENLLKIKNLYSLKSMGIDYFDGYNQDFITNSVIPSDIYSLKNMCKNCNLCNLSKSRSNVVFGEGNLNSELFFVGEAPGEFEDLSGKPFIGKAGKLLTKMIEKTLFLKREDVYISNIVKCRPPNNRKPTIEEAQTCKAYLLKEIEIIKPKIIVCLGGTAFHYLMEDDRTISKVRGMLFNFMGSKLIPTFHPSFLLRNPSRKRDSFDDMKLIRSFL